MKRIALLFITLLLWTSAKAQSPVNSVGSGCAPKFVPAEPSHGVLIPSTNLTNTPKGTVECWVWVNPNFDDEGSKAEGIIWIKSSDNCLDNPDKGLYYDHALSTFGVYFKQTSGCCSSTCAYITTSAVTGKWVHLAVTWEEGGQMALYVNGILSGNASIPTLYTNTVAPFSIGEEQYTNYDWFDFDGKIDEVRIWDYARTETEIRRDMCRRLTGTEPGLVGYWRFDDCGGNVALDSSPNGNHGTLY